MYAKIFTSIYQGTLRGNSHGLLVFTNLLAHSDEDGIVDIHPRAIADEVGLSIDEVRKTLLMLESPDDESRSPDEQGRRIVRLDEHRAWGWMIVNYKKYRNIKSKADRKEQNRIAQQKWREKNKLTVSKDKHSSAESAQAEVEAEVEVEVEVEVEPIVTISKDLHSVGQEPDDAPKMTKIEKAQDILDGLNAIAKTKFRAVNPNGTLTASGKLVLDRIKEGYTDDDFATVILGCKKRWQGKTTQDGKSMLEYMRPKTLFSKTNFENYLGMKA